MGLREWFSDLRDRFDDWTHRRLVTQLDAMYGPRNLYECPECGEETYYWREGSETLPQAHARMLKWHEKTCTHTREPEEDDE